MGNMKDSGIEWIGMIPNSWEICRIKDKYQLITGFTPDTARDDFYDDENGYTWISIADMTKEGKNISESTAGISDIYVRSKHPEIVKKGSLLYSFKLSVGKVGFAQKELYTNEAIASFQENSDICLGYLYYAAFLIEENANINIYGAKILNQDLINNSVTIFPPLTEQQLIADFLDDKVSKVDDILSDLRKQVETLQKYKKSVITKAVTKGLDTSVLLKDSGINWIGEIPENWDISKIKYSAIKIGSGKTPKGGAEIYEDEGVTFIRSQNVYDDGLHLDDVKYINQTIDNEMKNTRLQYGDVLLNITGASIGRCCIYDINENGNVNQHVCIIRTNEKMVNNFVRYILNSEIGTAQTIINQMGGNRESLTFEQIGLFVIPVPSTDEQQEIVDYLDNKCAKIDELIADKEAQIEKMEKYKKSLIYEYVTGKKRVKGAV